MANLENKSNLYADLAQGAYTGREEGFMLAKPTKVQKKELENKGCAKYEFPNAKDTHGNDANTVYLQPDNTVKIVEELGTMRVPKINGGYDTHSYVKNTYKKGLLTDEKAGYNSYYVTDTPTLSKETAHTYFATRGSDGISLENRNDWLGNNYQFAVNHAYIPQAKLATTAMHQKIAEMRAAAPNATISMTGHSLGTMVTIQAIANLPSGDISKIDKVVLFQGPDARESINKMSEQAQKNIQALEKQGKIDYYVNAFDIVSMLNRNKKGVDEIGQVHYLLPKSFTSTFDSGNPGSSHDFGQYQLNPDGTPKEANLKDHAHIFVAGIKVSNLIDKYLNILTKDGQGSGLSLKEAIKLLVSGDYKDFEKEYSKIIADTEIASQWNGKVATIQASIRGASGSKKIELRSDLAGAVATQAKSIGEEYDSILQNVQQEAEDEIDAVAKEILEGAKSIRNYLSAFEVQAMIAPYDKSKLWNKGQATTNRTQTKQYKEKVTTFSDKLTTVAKNIQEYDRQAGNQLFKNK